MPEFRELPEDRLDEFRAMVRYAFRPEQGPAGDDESGDDEIPAPATVGTPYGLFDGDDLLTVCRHIEFETRVRGDTHPMDGLSAVASPPESRRQGLVGEMLRGSLERSRERGAYLSALWPFKTPFYANFGWATSNRAARQTCDPDALSFTRDHRHGEFVTLGQDDWERLAAVHDAHGESYELTMERTEEWWRKRVFQGWSKDPYVYGWERDGELAAYIAYVVAEDDGEKTLQVWDWAYVDHDARLALLRFLADHDSQVDEVSLWTPTDAVLLDVVPDPADVDVELNSGPMFRLVDVREALESLTYPADVDVSLVLNVEDDVADWNDDTYRVDVVDGTATVERTDATPDATLDVGALSQLYVGYRGAPEHARVGGVDADERAVDLLAATFPERTVFLREGF